MTDEEMWFRFFEIISKSNTYPDPLTVAQSATYCLEEFRRKHPTPDAELPPEEANETSKWYVKARAYGAIACRFREALTLIQMTGGRDATNVAKDALDWRTSNRGGVPIQALEEFEALMNTEDVSRRALTHSDAILLGSHIAEYMKHCRDANGKPSYETFAVELVQMADEMRKKG